MTKILNKFKGLRKTQIQYTLIPKNKLEKFHKLPGHNPSHSGKLYRTLLMTKQAIKYYYGFRAEKPFKNLFKKAMKIDKINIINVFQDKLEKMLSTIVYRILRTTIRHSRQLVNHKFVRINGNPINLPMYEVREGDIISFKNKSLDLKIAKTVLPTWIKRSQNKDTDEITFQIVEDKFNLEKNKAMLLNVDYSTILRFYSK